MALTMLVESIAGFMSIVFGPETWIDHVDQMGCRIQASLFAFGLWGIQFWYLTISNIARFEDGLLIML
jgi:hypothetical protein